MVVLSWMTGQKAQNAIQSLPHTHGLPGATSWALKCLALVVSAVMSEISFQHTFTPLMKGFQFFVCKLQLNAALQMFHVLPGLVALESAFSVYY